MGYKLLGIVVWRGAVWYFGRRLASLSATRKVALAGGLTAAAAVLLLLAGGSAKKVRPAGQLRS